MLSLHTCVCVCVCVCMHACMQTQKLNQLQKIGCTAACSSFVLHRSDASLHQFFRHLAMLSFWQLWGREVGGIAAETEALR